MDLLRSQVLQPFPTPGSGTLWVAGESLRNRRVSCLPRWTVCPTCSPSLGTNRSTCRGECSWSGPFLTPPGRCHRGPLTNGPGRIRLYCVCSGGADTVTGGAPRPLRLGPSPASPVGPFLPAPHFAVWFAVVVFPSLRGGVVVVVGGGVFAVPGRVACVGVASSSGCGSPSVCVFVARCVRAWCLCWCVVRGLWCVVCRTVQRHHAPCSIPKHNAPETDVPPVRHSDQGIPRTCWHCGPAALDTPWPLLHLIFTHYHSPTAAATADQQAWLSP